jgi:hypothetical protein
MTVTVNPSRYTEILDAIHTIGLNSGITFPNNKKGEVPSPEEIAQSMQPGQPGFPWWSVRQGVWKTYATGASENSGGEDDGMRGIGAIEPVWNFDCYMFWHWSKAVPNYDKAATAMVTLMKAFSENIYLNNTCAVSTLHSPGVQYIELGNTQITAAKFTVKAYEILYVNYS